MNKMKKYIAIIYCVIVIISGFLKYYYFEAINETLLTSSVKGFLVVAIGGAFYCYSQVINKKEIKSGSLLVVVFGYAITIYATFRAGISFSELSIGGFLYYGAIIPLIISLLPENIANDIGKIASEENIPINGKYFLCNYISGIKENPNIYKSASVLVCKDDSSSLDINIKAENEIKIQIDDSKLQK